MWLLLTAFVAWFVAQLIKFALKARKQDSDFRLLYQSGGMPSAHAATVSALSMAVLISEGPQSPLFSLTVVFAAIVIYDSLGVRRSSGEQSVVLNKLLKRDNESPLLKEVLGHTPKEVLAGIVLGAVIACLSALPLMFEFEGDASGWLGGNPVVHAGWLPPIAGELAWHQGGGARSATSIDSGESWITSEPEAHEKQLYLAVFSFLLVVGIGFRLLLARLQSVATQRKMISLLWWGILTPALFGLFFVLLQYQSFGAATWRLWAVGIFAVIVALQALLTWYFYRHFPGQYREESAQMLRQKQSRSRQKTRNTRSKKRRK